MVTRIIRTLVDYIEEIENIDENHIQTEISNNYPLIEHNKDSYNYYQYQINNHQADNKHTKYKLFFRGHSNEEYKLIPSAFRKNNWNYEDYFYHQIMVYCPEHFQFSTHLDRLVTMQHYGCPTRLLDITANPLVALYFACVSNPDNDGMVIVFANKEDDIVFSDSDRVVMLSCLARFSNQDKLLMYKQSMVDLIKHKFTKQSGNHYYANKVIENLFHEITIELPSFKREMKPIDLLKPIFVQPNKTNGRILKQEGAFIISGLSKNADEAEQKINSLAFKRIIIENKKHILNQLEAIGIHQASLFPEVDRVAEYLKQRVNKSIYTYN